MNKKKTAFITVLVFVLTAVLLIGCVPESAAAIRILPELSTPQALTGGVLNLKINPEIALHYDETGKVTKLEGRNSDGQALVRDYTGYAGKDTAEVLTELVERIGKAGYFVDEADGKARQIILELDPGSGLPSDTFLEDMAAHVKFCVENQGWVGEREFEYQNVPTATAPAASGQSTDTVPAGLCPICADDDCNDGIYCDDAHEKAENLRKYERLMSGNICAVCADPDCDDGIYCDDADEKAENQRENTAKKSASTGKTSSASRLCPICADDDCDDGIYCDDADEKAENQRERENRKSGKRCSVCGDYDCDDGAYCDDWDDRYDDDDDDDD